MHRFSPTTVLFACLLAGCASLRPPAGDTSAPAQADEETVEGLVTVSAVEGRPNGMVLAVEGGEETAGATTLELYRQLGDSDPELIHDLAISEIVDRLPFDIVDAEVKPGGRYRYHAVLVDEEGVVSVSRSEWVSWGKPPPIARDITAVPVFGDVIEVNWEGPPDSGAIVFRRDVLTEGSRFERVAELESGHGTRWFDRDVTPAGVWSYRVALSRGDGDFVQYGPPSEEVYASTPQRGEP